MNRATGGRAANHWSLGVLSAGPADAHTAARAALQVQSLLRRDYDLATHERSCVKRWTQGRTSSLHPGVSNLKPDPIAKAWKPAHRGR